MRKSCFTEAQIIEMIKEQEAGLPTAELGRKYGLSPAISKRRSQPVAMTKPENSSIRRPRLESSAPTCRLSL